jgi:hypothetical protein
MPWQSSETLGWAFRLMNEKKSGTGYIEATKAGPSAGLALG